MGPPAGEVVLFGVGSPIVVDIEESCHRAGWSIVAAIRNVDGPVHTGPSIPILTPDNDAWRAHPVLVPLFRPANRFSAWQQAVSLGTTDFPRLLDPTSILPRRIDIEEGVYINAGCVLGAGSRIGRFGFVNRGASLGHHLDLGEFASVGPGAVIAGQVTIGPNAMIGAGAVILPGVTVGAGALVGAGCIIRADVPAGSVVRGTDRP